MADYWVSRDKYFCKYCKIYISDDKPSRTHHETGLRHKGNYERYIRDIYKKGVTEKKEAREEAKEIARIEAAAAAAMGLPSPSSEPTASTSSSTSSSKPPPKPTKSSDPYANYTTASSLGIKDEVAEQLQREREMREKEGTIGVWQRVVKPSQPVKGKGKQAEIPTGGFVTVKTEEGEGKPLLVPAGDVAPPPGLRAGSQEEGENDDDTHPVSLAKKRGFLSEKTASYLDDDDDSLLPSLAAPIKLKKRRLTVKEQAALDAEEEAKKRAEEEKKEEARTRGAGGGWAAARVDDDEGFDPLAGLGPVAGEEKGEGEGAGEGDNGTEGEVKKEGQEEQKPVMQAGGGFKKRKMHGAGALRKK